MNRLLNGEYELGKRLGGGAEGDVYEATSAKTGKKVAVKIAKRASDAEGLAAIKSLKGSLVGSCAPVLDAFALDGKVVTVLELADGVPLRERLASADLGSSKRQALARELLRAAGTLHESGLAHGDLSPDNIFVSRSGKVTLIDPRISAKPAAGAVLGTANYTAPEMLAFGSVPGPCADAFSLAALIYEIFEGRDAFGCLSPEEYVLKAGAKSLAVRPFAKTPESFRAMIAAGLELDPRARAQNADGLLQILERPRRRKRQAALAGAFLLLALGIRLSFRAGDRLDSIAVLPFVNETKDPDAEYLSDGLTESIINGLAQLPDVRVSPRNKVFRYKGRDVDPLGAARDLGVRAVLTGRLLKRGEDLLVSVELLDARSNTQVWGERYDRKTAAALEVQKDISRRIFETLEARMTGAARRRLAKRGTDNPEAYQAYLKGRYYWNRRTAANLGKALDEFQKAVDADPAYALAYLGLADAYALLEQYAGVPASETLPKARAAAQRAIELDDSLGEAHASLGYIGLMSWKTAEAEAQVKRALELEPNYSTGRVWYGTVLHVQGRYDEALAQTRLAQQADPLSPINGSQACNVQLIQGKIDLAIGDCRKVLELDERFPRAHELLGWAYLSQGRGEEALAQFKKAAEFSGRASQELAYIGYGYGRLGRRAQAQAIIKELEGRYAKRQSPGLFLAAVHGSLGEKDRAFAWLEKDFSARSGILVYVTFFPIFDTLRDDPRYGELLRRMGIR